jgi:probable HAF family extracellular repeat protein
MIDLGTLGGRSSFAAAVNGRGQVIGDSDTGTGSTGTGVGHAFLWQNGSMTDLGTLGFGTNFLGQVVVVGERNLQASRASAINERGQIVGWSTTKTGQTHAFVWQNGRMIDLGTLKGDVESGAVALKRTRPDRRMEQNRVGRAAPCPLDAPRRLTGSVFPGNGCQRRRGCAEGGCAAACG